LGTSVRSAHALGQNRGYLGVVALSMQCQQLIRWQK
jgi:HPt (histidine-containing phosphotransfer) domain-containing protein